MKHNQYKIRAHVWLYPGMTSWHFVTVPKDVSEDIKHNFGDRKRGWGSLPVVVSIGNTSWKTSIFPDKETGGYLLPLKAVVRKKENIVADTNVSFLLEIKV